jgi:hypothetical protein
MAHHGKRPFFSVEIPQGPEQENDVFRILRKSGSSATWYRRLDGKSGKIELCKTTFHP